MELIDRFLDKVHTIIYLNRGTRRCKACRKERAREHYLRNKK